MYERELFRSHDAEETHARVSRELKPHRSVWGRGDVDAIFCRAELSALSLCILRYGCDVDIEPDALGNFVLVQMPLRGHADVHTGGHTLQIHPGQGAVISAHKPVRLHWHADCEQLILKIELSRLQEVARHAFALRGTDDVGEIDFAMPFAWTTPPARSGAAWWPAWPRCCLRATWEPTTRGGWRTAKTT